MAQLRNGGGAGYNPVMTRFRIRDLGIRPGVLSPGVHNGITDVAGVRVGHETIIDPPRFHTGVTAIVPHDGNLFRERAPAAIHVINGFGKLAGLSQVNELGELETPILLTNTLAVPRAMDALLTWTLEQDGNEDVRSINAVVGETNDGELNDIRARIITEEHGLRALANAVSDPVAEGAVGAGAGTIAFGYKGGIGTSSRVLPAAAGGYTVGALVQSNYGGVLTVDGRQVGKSTDQHYLADMLREADGSIMIVVATDAPVSSHSLMRIAKRGAAGLARTGSALTNGSGDYTIAFSTHPSVRRHREKRTATETLTNDELSPLFLATIEAVEEAILNSLTMATPVNGFRKAVEALPLDLLQYLAVPCGTAI